MILKLMSSEDCPDESTCKGCRVIDHVQDVNYYRNPHDGSSMMMDVSVGTSIETINLVGNAYLMNDSGKTINSYAAFGYSSPAPT